MHVGTSLLSATVKNQHYTVTTKVLGMYQEENKDSIYSILASTAITWMYIFMVKDGNDLDKNEKFNLELQGYNRCLFVFKLMYT